MRQRAFPQGEAVDFVIVGSGAAGGVLAKELATNGFSVVVLEQGPWRRAEEFRHDELGNWFLNALLPEHPATFRRTAEEQAHVQTQPPAILYAQGVGGSSVHFTANFWRLRPVDFEERSLLGPISGTGFADWPITYEELEPYFPKQWPGKVRVKLAGGKSLVSQVLSPKGEIENPMSTAELEEKFQTLAVPVLGTEKASMLAQGILGLENSKSLEGIFTALASRST